MKMDSTPKALLLTTLLVILSLSWPTSARSEEINAVDKKLKMLTIGAQDILQIEAGKSLKLTIGTIAQGGVYEESKFPVLWSVDTTEGISLNPKTGELWTEDAVASIKTAEVTADVDNGRKMLTKKLYVYNPLSAPLIRIWHEHSQISCADGKEIFPSVTIEELEFRADGRFSVTWMPFEYYKDYWGDYSVDFKLKELELKPSGGNYLPGNIAKKGHFAFSKEGRLTILGIYLGDSKLSPTPVASCGHIFK